MINAEIWLDDYPPDIREKFGPISQKAKRRKGIVSIFFLLAGYSDLGFHARGFAIGTVISVVFSAITAGIVVLVL